MKVQAEESFQRLSRVIRDTEQHIYYFTKWGSERIETPPHIPKHLGLQVNDLYIHRTNHVNKAWRCTSIEPQVLWEDLPEGTTEDDENDDRRTFVITRTGLPGWVASQTVHRKYKQHAQRKIKKKDANRSQEAETSVKRGGGGKGKGKA